MKAVAGPPPANRGEQIVDRRFRSTCAALLVLSAVGPIATLAYAAPKDAAAQKLVKSAMEDDFLATNWSAAEAKLRDALKECGASGCAPAVKADIFMNLGIILVNAKKNAEATAAFSDGLKADPAAVPNKDYVSPDVQKAFDDAKGAAPAPTATGTGTAPAKPEPDNDLKFDPPTEALVDYPLPLWVGAESGATKFVVYFKAFGAGEFSKAEMKKMGRGFGVEIPCGQTNTTGTLKYYIQALDSGGDVISSAGSRKTPLEVKLTRKLAGEQPAFPGKEPPSKCLDTTCPPGMEDTPECKKSSSSGGSEGDSCSGDNPCKSAYSCVEGTCRSEDAGGPIKKNLLSLALVLDDAIVSSGEVCSRENYDSGVFNCFRQDSPPAGSKRAGTLYDPGSPNDPAYAGRDRGTVAGLPFAVGTVRILLGYDRVVWKNLAVGARLGYAFNGGPSTPVTDDKGNVIDEKKFLPFHFEARLSYWIGKDVLAKVGVRPFVFLGGGAGQVDAKIPGVPVSNDCKVVGEACPAVPAGGSAKKIPVDAWRRMGQGFIAGGGGIVYAVTKNSGLLVEIKGSYFFPTPGVAISPSIGFMQQL
jgi:hypothetical protein